ncbi:sulfite oxidase subunit YedY [Thiohalobacter thiocyanaticus]|uniref:Protein-methionine-sulfoxide reductase catalytic subunit MsrP n=1 Tax=Thiohalobacter thiocyanaticus TaxID=585455 RepID=A0A1Z4VQ09_9GAMM|nr:protein-methionine-sulfoxide reductase catalytic subunit MsrP [Thiohalobacter thiocyanaticus]BAZ93573.1 sulfite oxidase subunit YedY [Thiohalobacter thiocyanaticus]
MPNRILPSDITPESVYRERRRLMQAGLAVFGAGLTGTWARLSEAKVSLPDAITGSRFSTDEALTPFEDVTTYNNFYEFGTGKGDPAENAHRLQIDPWSVTVEGECARPGTYALEDILKPHDLEERIYRLRCVEGWSMVIPWVGFPLRDLIKRLEPVSNAKYIEFQTLYDPEQMPGQRRRILDWPYVEGLRMDEAMHPLTILAVGLYGKVMPNQNGAPIRLVVPWKYGFKSIKSIVKIRFVEQQPVSSWMRAAPDEYGFYSNVNPNVDHPRWSQARERRIGEFLKRPTLMFNGYEEEVADLYRGMDLRKHF